MHKISHAAGLPKEVLDVIPDIVDTCRECRRWQKPGNETIASANISTKFDEDVEMDLMFYKEDTVCHCIDRASRWRATKSIADKTDQTLAEALVTAWIGIHGLMEILISDGESGVVKGSIFLGELKSRGIELKIRAPSQHARYIERIGALLRQAMRIIEEQLKREGVNTTFPILLAEATVAGNCLTHVGGATPYQVVYGRQPSILPPIAIQTGEDLDEPSAGNDRVEARIREVALQAMIEATSQARISRAMNTKTQIPGERLYTKGDIVE
jgi:hypothetical protein